MPSSSKRKEKEVIIKTRIDAFIESLESKETSEIV